MNKIKQGDKIIVIAGKDKTRTGKVLRILRKSQRVIVEGINLVKKHVRENPNKNEKGGIIDREAPLHISNVALLNPVTGKADRVGIKTLDDGKKVRYFKSNNETIDA